jgi:hypothetical protein
MRLIQILRQQQQVDDEGVGDPSSILPIRIFQIVDQQNGTPLFTWPQQKFLADSKLVDLAQSAAKEMVLQEFKSSSFDDKQHEDISCTRHFYASTKLDFLKERCLLQRILIPYGSVVFESFQVAPAVIKLSATTVCSPLYQHYFMNPDFITSTLNTRTNSNASSSSAQSPVNYDFIGKNNYYTTNAAANLSSNSSKSVAADAVLIGGTYLKVFMFKYVH